jgi:hypothetical protein
LGGPPLPPPPTRTNGESALILQAQSACKISALNEDYTNEMLPKNINELMQRCLTLPFLQANDLL